MKALTCMNVFLYKQKLLFIKDNCQIIVVHVHATVFFLKFTQCVTILQTVSNQVVAL